jgi:hypothetical protein
MNSFGLVMVAASCTHLLDGSVLVAASMRSFSLARARHPPDNNVLPCHVPHRSFADILIHG